ncbi:phytanoyl-CoA dioxygenase family protein [Paenibacillaceae bacterium]|nr:phytanoyl-CoA dioxygenase family protein [Paenibacillaceae bacterium]
MESLTIAEELNKDYSVSATDAEQYQKNGHICLREVASAPVIDFLRKDLHAVIQKNQHEKPVKERNTYGKAFIQVGNIWEYNEAVRQFVFARRFAKIAAELMGVSGVRLYHDQALFKEPGGGHTPWHQDQVYWPFDTQNMITLWMPLVNVPQEMGTMTFASGSHKAGYVNKVVISDESHKTLQQYIDGKGFEKVTHGAMNAGDATFHAGWTMHSAPDNPTDRMREVMTIIYVADGEPVCEADTNARKADLARFLPGINPGEPATSYLNPLLYSRDS